MTFAKRNGTLTANGDTEPIQNTAKDNTGTLFVSGTFGTGTVKLQASPDAETWFDVDTPAAVSFTAAGYKNFEIKAGYFRLNLSGATSPNIDYWLV